MEVLIEQGEKGMSDATGPAATMGAKMQTMYRLKGIPYLPHYQKDGLYVAPGGMLHGISELRRLRAVPEMAMLWERNYLTKVDV